MVSLSDDVASAAGHDSAVLDRQISDGGVLQHAQDRLPHRLPHLPLGAAPGLGADAGVVQAVDGQDRALQGLDHLAHRQCVGVADEEVAPLRPAHAADEAGTAQGGQKLLQIGLGDTLASGDVAALGRLGVTVVVGQLDDSTYPVVAFSGNLHA